MAWLNQTFKFKVPPTLGRWRLCSLTGGRNSTALHQAKELVEKHGRRYGNVANMAASLVAVASF
eukprot:1724339-Prymnesium_polylepis.1